MKLTATELRQNLYRVLDSVLETGEEVQIARKGRVLRIVAESAPSIWDRLEPHAIVKGDPEDLVSMDWSEYWSGDDSLP